MPGFTESWTPITGVEGLQALSVTSAAAVALTIPPSASKAVISLEADSTSTSLTRAVRYSLNNVAPTATVGQSLGDNDVLELTNHTQLQYFKAIGIEAGKTHSLKIQYYKD